MSTANDLYTGIITEARALEADALQGGNLLRRAWSRYGVIEHMEQQAPLTPAERRSLLGNHVLLDRIGFAQLYVSHLARALGKPFRAEAGARLASTLPAWQQVEILLEDAFRSGLIRKWAPSGESKTCWIAEMSNGHGVLLNSVHQARLFCWGVESARDGLRESA